MLIKCAMQMVFGMALVFALTVVQKTVLALLLAQMEAVILEIINIVLADPGKAHLI